MHGEKIRLIREIRGLSQENISSRLGIAQNTYSKIERNQIKLESAMLVKIAEVLQVSPMDILSTQPAIINFNLKETTNTPQSFKQVENVYASKVEVLNQIIMAKNEEISRLNTIIQRLLSGDLCK